MRIRPRTLRRLFLFLFLFVVFLLAPFSAAPALSQNLLLNPGFDRDLAGWEVRTEFYPPGNVDASAQWEAVDALGGASGSVRFRLNGGRQTVNRVQLTQCFAATPGRRYTGGGILRTDDQLQDGGFVSVEMFFSAGCSGDPVASSGGGSLPWSGFTHTNSGGAWLPVSASVPAGVNVQSVRYSVGIYSSPGSYYSHSAFDGLFDDAYLIEEADPAATWILPAAGRGAGAAGSLWTTTLSLANPGSSDALVKLKFLGHDADGRSGPEKTVFVRAGSLLEYPDVLSTLFMRTQDYGAIRITSSSASLVVQSETSTPSMGGTVGQALPAFGPDDFAGATPKALAPIRENAEFRTNLVLANATEIPITAHVALFAADGTQIGSRDVDLPPLGMTQINRVAAALGASSLDTGRIAVSTPTPGGLVAAYASVIDNATNDPRTVLPRDPTKAIADTSVNVLTNPGFDRDLSNWEPLVSTLWDPDFSMAWGSTNASESGPSGSLTFHAYAGPGTGVEILRWQCVPVAGGEAVTFGAKFLIGRQNPQAHTGVAVGFFKTSGCGAYWEASPYKGVTSLRTPSSGETSSQGEWRYAAASTSVPPDARSMGVYVRVIAAGSGDRTFPYRIPGYVDGSADDVFVAKTELPLTRWLLPSAAWAHGTNSSDWITRLTLANPGAQVASITLKWLGHDSDGRIGRTFVYSVGPGETMSVPVGEWTSALGESWGAVLATADFPILLQSETSTPTPGGGSVGQALSAFNASDFAGAAPKTLAPIRENAEFRTNLVLVNATEIPVTAHVTLFAADGSPIGTRDVDLPPLGMTQINRVAAALGATTLDAGRLSVSTPTPGGRVAAYASVIDNVTNDPRTLLPR